MGMTEAGARAFALLMVSMQGIRIQKEWRDVPFLIPSDLQRSSEEPCASILAAVFASSTEKDILSVDFAAGQPLADVAHSHPAIVVYAVDATSAEEIVELMLEKVLSAEGDFSSDGHYMTEYKQLLPGIRMFPGGPVFAGSRKRKAGSHCPEDEFARPEFTVVETID